MARLVWVWCLIAVPYAVGHTQARTTSTIAAIVRPSESPVAGCAPAGVTPATTATGWAACADDPGTFPRPWQSAAARPSSLWSVPASAFVPGVGQAMLGVWRFVPYLAIEAYGWWQYTEKRSDFRRHRSAYRNLAATVARAPFTPNPPTGDFAYYERMAHWLESGAFDRVPGGEVEPELDSLTYNGAMWLLARRTYWADPEQPPTPDSPEFVRAMDFYVRRAYEPAYQWSWRGAESEQDRFRRLIGESNDANRRAIQFVGLVVANHLLSTIDAYVTVRLRRQNAGAGISRWELTVSLPFSPP